MLSPLTGSSGTQKIRDIDPKTIAARWLQELGIGVGKDFETLPIIEHWRCDTTHFEWYEPASCAGTGALYSQLQKFDWYYMADKWEFRTALSYFEKNSRVLEIGSGFGFFLNAARKLGIDGVGVELNPTAAFEARKGGHTVYEKELKELIEKFGSKFDGVCAFQVLEHIPNPMSFFQDSLHLLRPRGKLILSVPNADFSRFIDPDRKGLLDQPPHHISHWDEFVFRKLENLLPVRILAAIREPLQPYHVGWFVSSIGSRLQKRWGKFFSKFLVNRLSFKFSNRLLQMGLRKLIIGHTLLVVLEKNL